MKKILVLFILIASVVFTSCKRDNTNLASGSYQEPKLPPTPYDYKGAAEKISQFVQSGAAPTIDNDVATLGRVLFYEKQLSVNNVIACGSCHIQTMGFADGRQFSPGFENINTPRNSPGIANPGGMRDFFWDARAGSGIREMVVMPVQNHLEMGIDNLDYAVAKLEALPYYKKLFANAFGSEQVSKDKIAIALEHFLRSMTVTETKFDNSGWNDENFTEQEKQGKKLFETLHCKSCHKVEVTRANNNTVLANIGLDLEYKDNGVSDAGNPQRTSEFYKGVFKTPTLRNIELTAPYMHDGRFATLEEVIEHYNSGVQPHQNLTWWLTNHNLKRINESLPITEQRPVVGMDRDPARLNLSDVEKQALIAFLKTLTDYEFISNPMYSDPFAH